MERDELIYRLKSFPANARKYGVTQEFADAIGLAAVDWENLTALRNRVAALESAQADNLAEIERLKAAKERAEAEREVLRKEALQAIQKSATLRSQLELAKYALGQARKDSAPVPETNKGGLDAL